MGRVLPEPFPSLRASSWTTRSVPRAVGRLEPCAGKLASTVLRGRRRSDAPLLPDERALKRAIRHRKNSMFYKTLHGAKVGDIYMSLIHSCELCGVNPFEYLQALQIHAQQVQANAALWLPWNFHQQRAPGG
jgi:hypothetical protein